MPRLRDRQREETSRAILAGAEEVFAEEGLSARMERIAARAGVAVGTLYNHFADRGALLEALMCARRSAFLGRIDEAVAATAGRPISERLSALMNGMAEHLRHHGKFLAIVVQAGEGPVRPHARAGLHQELVARMEQVMAAAVAAGELRAGPGAGLLADAFLALAKGAMFRSLDGGPTLAEVAPALVDLFLRGARP
jgi:AcrR family transcriptional regulator